jgi:hypothetical protein
MTATIAYVFQSMTRRRKAVWHTIADSLVPWASVARSARFITHPPRQRVRSSIGTRLCSTIVIWRLFSEPNATLSKRLDEPGQELILISGAR